MHKLGFESKTSTLVPPAGFADECLWKLMKAIYLTLFI